ncbi:MAG: hypothetical protein J6U50_03935 [Lachnospiraceae bacterium]|nr:hypothetical protein [Lachnospiraceae bacterium]
MRIRSSVTGMESERSYNAVSYSARSLKLNMVGKGGAVSGVKHRGGTGVGKYPEGGSDRRPVFYGTLSRKAAPGSDETRETKMASITDIMESMTGVSRHHGAAMDIRDPETDIYSRKMSVLYIFSLLFGEFRSRMDELMAGVRSGYEEGTQSDAYGDGLKMEMTRENIYYERECTSFRAKGMAVCADGREIDFNINVGMSRSFEKISRERMSFDPIRCMDPLVINLKEGVTSVSDQYIYFDLDGDGEAERIKSLSEKSGYIALDKNGDGIINDGTELFGTKSGDGFADLAAYDTDGDGWIDEDDDIFDKLKIWVRSGDGTDSLLSFREAGVGAINLARSQTEFSIRDEQNRTDAIIRATGMFLYEDGRAGTMQQVDMVS